ncbi:MAG: cupin domain-containing protein [Desulfitobacterium hafniense]|nr:cupin domain-containing protein [Desulfitobacterium hafniense]
MNNVTNVLQSPQFREDAVNKVTTIKTEELGADVYYFKPGQVLDFHRHLSDQIFFVLKGEGKFYLKNGHTQEFNLEQGSNILAPKGNWHKLVNTGREDLVAVQVTKLPTDLEQLN